MKKIKVIYLRSTFNPGGTEYLLLSLFNNIQEALSFYYIFLRDGNLINELKSNTNSYIVFNRSFYIDVNILLNIKRIIHKHEIKIIHTHQLIELIYAVILKSFIWEINIYHTIHGFSKNKFYNFIEKKLVAFTKNYFTVSKSSKQKLVTSGYPKNNFSVLYNAVNQPIAPIVSDLEWFHSKINKTDSDIVIGMVGNIVWQKDHLTLIKAFEIIIKKNPNYKLVLFGNYYTDSGKECEKYVDENKINNIFFLGSIPNASKFVYLFDLFVFATLEDTFGIALIEALMAGTKVLTSDADICMELKFNSAYFPVYKKGMPSNLASMLIHCINTNYNQEIINAKKYYLDKFSYSSYIKNLQTIYNNEHTDNK